MKNCPLVPNVPYVMFTTDLGIFTIARSFINTATPLYGSAAHTVRIWIKKMNNLLVKVIFKMLCAKFIADKTWKKASLKS